MLRVTRSKIICLMVITSTMFSPFVTASASASSTSNKRHFLQLRDQSIDGDALSAASSSAVGDEQSVPVAVAPTTVGPSLSGFSNSGDHGIVCADPSNFRRRLFPSEAFVHIGSMLIHGPYEADGSPLRKYIDSLLKYHYFATNNGNATRDRIITEKWNLETYLSLGSENSDRESYPPIPQKYLNDLSDSFSKHILEYLAETTRRNTTHDDLIEEARYFEARAAAVDAHNVAADIVSQTLRQGRSAAFEARSAAEETTSIAPQVVDPVVLPEQEPVTHISAVLENPVPAVIERNHAITKKVQQFKHLARDPTFVMALQGLVLLGFSISKLILNPRKMIREGSSTNKNDNVNGITIPDEALAIYRFTGALVAFGGIESLDIAFFRNLSDGEKMGEALLFVMVHAVELFTKIHSGSPVRAMVPNIVAMSLLTLAAIPKISDTLLGRNDNHTDDAATVGAVNESSGISDVEEDGDDFNQEICDRASESDRQLDTPKEKLKIIAILVCVVLPMIVLATVGPLLYSFARDAKIFWEGLDATMDVSDKDAVIYAIGGIWSLSAAKSILGMFITRNDYGINQCEENRAALEDVTRVEEVGANVEIRENEGSNLRRRRP